MNTNKSNIPTGDDDELKNIAPLLHSLSKSKGYNPPDAYFEELPARVMNAVAGKSSPENPLEKIFVLFSRPSYAFGAAALVTLIMCVGYFTSTHRVEITDADQIFEYFERTGIRASDEHYIAEFLMENSEENETFSLFEESTGIYDYIQDNY